MTNNNNNNNNVQVPSTSSFFIALLLASHPQSGNCWVPTTTTTTITKSSTRNLHQNSRGLSFVVLPPIPSTASVWGGTSYISSSSCNHHRRQRISLVATAVHSGPFFGPEEEFECPDEEECEIDWDKMPGFLDDDDGDQQRSDESDSLLETEMEWEQEEEEEEDLFITSNSFAKQAFDSLEKGKVRLEMNWQIDECKTDEDMCEDFCDDCAGSGQQYCRFCRGTGILTFGDEFRSCLICKSGKEECSSCRGTGHIAPWAATMENYLDGKSI